MNAYETKVLDVDIIATHTLSVTCKKPDGFTYSSGQHIGVKILNPAETDSTGNIRTLSMASAPSQDHLEIATRLRDSAFKQSLAQLNAGDVLEIDGPYGSMTLHSDTNKPAIFLAGGIGITPFISMIRENEATDSDHEVYLFYSNKTADTAAFLEELQSFSKRDDIVFEPTMTREDAGWDGKTGYITDEVIQENIDDIERPVYYLAGPNEFVKAMEALLSEMGVPELHVRAEIFSGYEK